MAKPIYEGSVKNLWEVDPAHLEFEYTNAYSVFDWGRMPDEIAYKGESLAALGEYFFRAISDRATWAGIDRSKGLALLLEDGRYREFLAAELSDIKKNGLRHHFMKRSKPNGLLVRRVTAISPLVHKLAGRTLHDYSVEQKLDPKKPRLIPLEVVFRFGAPKGSSLFERLTPAYAHELGFSKLPLEGEKFERPVLEFFTKLEDTDRFLTWEQALNYSGLPFSLFTKLVARTLALASWLAGAFEKHGLELWDGKFEWALIDGELFLVDSIGPDELRLLDPATGTQISKEFLRLFYRPTKWFEAMKQAKSEAGKDNRLDWKKLVLERVGEPPRLSPSFKAAADAMYPSLALALAGENPGKSGVALPKMLERIAACLAR